MMMYIFFVPLNLWAVNRLFPLYKTKQENKPLFIYTLASLVGTLLQLVWLFVVGFFNYGLFGR